MFNELFYVLTSALVVFIALEIIWPGVVLAYININWVLILWLITVIIILIDNKIKRQNDQRFNYKKTQ